MGCSMNDIDIVINWFSGGTVMAWCNNCDWSHDNWPESQVDGVALSQFFMAADRHVYGAGQ